MKILHITTKYGEGYRGGVEKYVHRLSDLLETRGHTTAVIYGEENASSSISTERNAYYVPNICSFTIFPDSTSIRKVHAIVRSENPDVVHIHLMENRYLIKVLVQLKPVVLFVHNHQAICPSGLKLFKMPLSACDVMPGWICLWNAFARRCISIRPHLTAKAFLRYYSSVEIAKQAHAVTVGSIYMKELLVRNGLSSEKIYITPPVVEYPNLPVSHSYPHDNTILFIGRVEETKGIGFLIRSLRQLKSPYKLIVIGDGSYLREVKHIADQMGIINNIEFLGWIKNDDLPKYFEMSSVVVVPSILSEPFGMVGPEAMAYERPIIAFNVGAISEWLIHGETGFLIPPYDIDQLAMKIDFLLRHNDIAYKLGQRGRKILRDRFDPVKLTEKVLNVYQCAINEYNLRLYPSKASKQS
jgi:glycosyltransferase involved in cell wall biosynthesis